MSSVPWPRSALALAASLLLGLGIAGAATTPTGIEIDGNYTDDAPPQEDWFPNHPPSADPVGSADDSLCDGTSPAPKNDIAQYFLTNDYDYLYVGMERLTNNGNTSFFLRIDVTGDGPSLGDFIFVFCFGSGAVVSETYVLEWDPAAGDWARDATPPEVLFAVNPVRAPAPFGTIDERGRPENSLDPGRFAEARIRLADIEGFDICLAADVTGVIESKSSCSLSSECKDTTGPFRFSFEPLQVAVSATQSSDCGPSITAIAAVSSPRGGTTTFRWYLDGEDITDRDPAWASSPVIVIALDDECGEVEIRVVVDDGTCTAEDATTVDVNRRPVATITSLNVGACDRVLTFDGAASTDCNGAALTYLWDFDSNGIPDASGASGTFTYPDCGDRLVTLVVSDGDCFSEPAFAQVHVNEPPVASLIVVPLDCLEVSYRSASTDCDLARPSATHPETLTEILDFGDASPPAPGGTGVHGYAGCGTYVLTLTVTDSSGCTDADSRRVTFNPVLDVR